MSKKGCGELCHVEDIDEDWICGEYQESIGEKWYCIACEFGIKPENDAFEVNYE